MNEQELQLANWQQGKKIVEALERIADALENMEGVTFEP
jgi:uncharacterized protein Yka (UPF0111/DUF47 family)